MERVLPQLLPLKGPEPLAGPLNHRPRTTVSVSVQLCTHGGPQLSPWAKTLGCLRVFPRLFVRVCMQNSLMYVRCQHVRASRDVRIALADAVYNYLS